MNIEKYCNHIEKDVIPVLKKKDKVNIINDLKALCGLLKTNTLSKTYKAKFKEPLIFIKYMDGHINKFKKTDLGKDLMTGLNLYKKVLKENIMAKKESFIVECTHMYNGVPVRLQPEFNYVNDPNYAQIYDPHGGQLQMVPVSSLKPLVKVMQIEVDEKPAPKKEAKKVEKKKRKGGKKVEEAIIEFLGEKRDPNFLQGESKPKKGAFHRWLGKSEDSPITDADIKKGLASKDPHVVKMANFARNAKKWKHTGPKNESISSKLDKFLEKE